MLQQRKLKKHWLMMWRVLILESWSMLKHRKRILYRINLVGSTTFLDHLRVTTYSNDYPVFKTITFTFSNSICDQSQISLPFSWAWANQKNYDSSHPFLRPRTHFPLNTYVVMKPINTSAFLLYCSLESTHSTQYP